MSAFYLTFTGKVSFSQTVIIWATIMTVWHVCVSILVQILSIRFNGESLRKWQLPGWLLNVRLLGVRQYEQKLYCIVAGVLVPLPCPVRCPIPLVHCPAPFIYCPEYCPMALICYSMTRPRIVSNLTQNPNHGTVVSQCHKAVWLAQESTWDSRAVAWDSGLQSTRHNASGMGQCRTVQKTLLGQWHRTVHKT